MVDVNVKQSHAWIVEMRKGAFFSNDQGLYWLDGQARAVTRIATHMLGRPGSHSMNVNAVGAEQEYAAIIAKSSPFMVSGGHVGYDPDGFDLYLCRYQHKEDCTYTTCQGEPTMSAGVPCVYDGEHISELGYHYYPWIELLTPQVGGILFPDGEYLWAVVYEWRDARGNVHKSAPSVASYAKLGAGNKGATLRVPTLQLTEKEDPENELWPVDIVLYRTVHQGSIFYKEQVLQNDKNQAYLTFISGNVLLPTDDDSIRVNEILYTDGGVLANHQPPASRHIVTHEARLWSISKDNPAMIFASKEIQPGFEVPGFALETVLQNYIGGGHVALASMGAQLVAFKEEGVFVYSGSPPNDLGGEATINGPIALSKSTGCINPKSVVSAPNGVAFQSRESIWLVDRSHQVTRIGAPIEDMLALYPICRFSALDQRRELIYFGMETDGILINPSIILCYHYMINEWTVWTLGASGGAVCWRDELSRYEMTLAGSNGVTYLSDGFIDPSATRPTLTVSTPWIQFAGLAGFQRAKRFTLRGTKIGRFSMIVRIYSDFDNSFFEQHILTQAEVDALTTGTDKEVHAKFHVGHGMQKCKAIRVEITATTQAPDTGGMVRWETIAFEIAGKKGLFKLPLAASR